MNDLMLNIFGGIVGGIVSGFFVYVIQVMHNNHKNKKDEQQRRIVQPFKDSKVITTDILRYLKPGVSLELAKNHLGTFYKYAKADNPIFYENDNSYFETNSYLYVFSNAYLKITSEDNISIDSITVIPFYPDIEIDVWQELIGAKETRLNKILFSEEMIDRIFERTVLRTTHESICAFNIFIGRPKYQYYTFFVNADFDWMNEDDIIYENLIGKEIFGICVGHLNTKSFYIYDYEKIDRT
ncbi:hypothetical protein KTO58_05665 [Chitinophaga pendula]|uniref:hypothetical protein n=1 Tax=Chitinophaga TaxID=79328 RepID=UPI000BB093D6|nr:MULTISPECIES: hypothetical protein [Chitinophaga]ASZ13710.1 hypothetical protein CK934_23505 [Chitinophaga sp. MD30]UCJ08673.1 hypothetical protein KTO58_05665 [Chitinophaga pendula]